MAMILWAGKTLFFFTISHQFFLQSSHLARASERVSWFPKYNQYKPTHYGKHFILGVTQPYNTDRNDQLLILALFDTNVTISWHIPGSSAHANTQYVKAGETTEYQLPSSLRTSSTTNIERKGIDVTASEDISVVVLITNGGHSDGYLALPTNVLGKEYVVASYSNVPEFAVISGEDQTTISIRPPASGSISYNGNTYNGGQAFSITLNRLQIFHLVNNANLSGTLITTDKRVAVISGDRDARLNSAGCDHFVTFLLPVKHWGMEFILGTVGTLNVGDEFRVFTRENNNTIRSGNRKTILDSGRFITINLINSPRQSYLTCSKPCQVVQYVNQQSRSGFYSDAAPSIISVPSTKHFMPSYHVGLLGGSAYIHSITLIIQKKFRDGLLKDGNSMTGLTWQCLNEKEYCWTIIPFSDDIFVTHKVSGVTFGLLVFGGANGISYGYPGGFSFKKEPKPCKRKVDLGFVLDSSGSVSIGNYQKMKTFVKDLTDYFTISPDETRVSVMSFSNDARIHIPFSRNFDEKELTTAIDAIDYSGGGTATAIALEKAYEDMFQTKNGARKTGASKVLIILTDGQSNGGIEGPALKLKNAGVIIFSVGIGQNINMKELYSMASQPKEQRVILLQDFQELSTLAKKMSSTTCNVSRFAVTCNKDSMSLTYEKSSLPDYINVEELALQDRSCKASHNQTHIIAKTDLNGCGTTHRETEQELIFSNALTTDNIPSGGEIIHRNKEISLKFSCSYGRLRTVGSFNFLPAKQKLTITEKKFGNLTFLMKFYKDSSYGQSYIDDDYPVSKSLSDRIHVQYSVDSSNSDIVIRAKACRATPTNKPYDQPQYVFIDEGCDKDSTIQHYTSGLQKVHRFSIQAFAFVINHRYVYFHCDLVLCNRNTANSICTRSTSCPSRKRREAQTADDGTKFYRLSTGPLIYRKKKDEANSNGNSSSKGHEVATGLLVAVAVLAILLISIFGILILRRRRTTYGTSSNVQVLSMENIAATKE